MTDTPTSLDALGIEPVAWHYHDESQRLLGFRRDYFASAEGLIETPLYSATDLAPLIAKARRVEELEAGNARLLDALFDAIALIGHVVPMNTTALIGGEKLTALNVWQAGHDLMFPKRKARAALKENTDATSD